MTKRPFWKWLFWRKWPKWANNRQYLNKKSNEMAKRAFESGHFSENGEFGENSENGEQSPKS